MSDPFGGRFVTAGNPYVAANGSSLGDQSPELQGQFNLQYGVADAPIVWAETANQNLLARGEAIQTTDGVIAMDTVRAQLQQHGYTGSNDVTSVTQSYRLLKTPPPATPPPAGSGGGSFGILGGGGGVGGLPTPVLIGGAVLLLVLLGGRR